MAITSEQPWTFGDAQIATSSRISALLAFVVGFFAVANFQLQPGTVNSPRVTDLMLIMVLPLAAGTFAMGQHRAATWLVAALLGLAALVGTYYALTFNDISYAATTVRVFLAIAAGPFLARYLLQTRRVDPHRTERPHAMGKGTIRLPRPPRDLGPEEVRSPLRLLHNRQDLSRAVHKRGSIRPERDCPGPSHRRRPSPSSAARHFDVTRVFIKLLQNCQKGVLPHL